MRRHWLLLLLLVVSIEPALARSPVRRPPPPPPVEAHFEPGIHAGTLVLTFHNDRDVALELPMRIRAGTIHYDWLTVELAGVHATRTLTFSGDRDKSAIETVTIPPYGAHVERIDLDGITGDLPRGEYAVLVTWDQPLLHAQIRATTYLAPLHCGLVYREAPPSPPTPQTPASRLPFVLGGLVLLLVGLGLAKRAGTAGVRVPCSLP